MTAVTDTHRALALGALHPFGPPMTPDEATEMVAGAIAEAEARGAQQHAAGRRCDHGEPIGTGCPACRAVVEYVRDHPPTTPGEPAAVEHVLRVSRYAKGRSPIGRGSTLYGSSGRCSCGWTGKSNSAPSQGGIRDLRHDHHQDTGHRAVT